LEDKKNRLSFNNTGITFTNYSRIGTHNHIEIDGQDPCVSIAAANAIRWLDRYLKREMHVDSQGRYIKKRAFSCIEIYFAEKS